MPSIPKQHASFYPTIYSNTYLLAKSMVSRQGSSVITLLQFGTKRRICGEKCSCANNSRKFLKAHSKSGS